MANTATVGSAVVKLSFDGKGVKSELSAVEKNVESSGSKIGGKVKTLGKNIGKALTAGFAVATAAAVAFTKSSIDAFNEQEKALAKLEQSAKNQNWAEGAVEDLKAYNSELQKVGIIGDEVNAAGQAQLGTFALSAEAIKTLTPAMDDLLAATSGYGTTADNATQMANLMGKVMTGNVGALTRYGVTLDENQKKLLTEGDEMTRAATLAEVLKQNYGGFNEALAQTPQGQVKQLSNNFGDLKEQFGAFIAGKGDLDGFFDQLTVVFDNISDLIKTMAPKVIEGIATLVDTILTDLPDLITELTPVVIDGIIKISMALAQALPSFLQATFDIIIAIADAIIANLPFIIQTLTTVLTQIALFLVDPTNLNTLLYTAYELFMALVRSLPMVLNSLIEAMPTIIEWVIAFLTDPNTIGLILDAAIQLFMALVMAVPQILGGLIKAFGTLVGSLWEGIKGMFGAFAANFGNFISGIFRNAINGMIGFIENFINTPINLINGFIDVINGAFGFIGVNLGKIDLVALPRLAEGGLASGATTAVIGEAGKEAVLPLENNTDNWAGLLASTLVAEMEMESVGGREIVVNMNNNINSRLDAEEIGRVMMQSIRRAA